MPHLLIIHPETDPWDLAIRAAADKLTLVPGCSWYDAIVVVHQRPPSYPDWDYAGPTDFAGLPTDPSPTLPALLPPRTDWAWDAAAQAIPGYVWNGVVWCRASTRYPVGPWTALRLHHRTAAHAAVLRRRSDRLRTWLATLAVNPVVPVVVTRIYPNGDAQLRSPEGPWLLLPVAEQTHRHYPGEALVVRVLSPLGGRATERDSALLRGLARRVMGATYQAPARDVWPAWTRAPRLALVLVARAGYQRWRMVLPTLQALSGRSIRVLREATPPSELVRQALRSSLPVTDSGRVLYIEVPAAEFRRWCATYGHLLPLVTRLLGRPVRPRITTLNS